MAAKQQRCLGWVFGAKVPEPGCSVEAHRGEPSTVRAECRWPNEMSAQHSSHVARHCSREIPKLSLASGALDYQPTGIGTECPNGQGVGSFEKAATRDISLFLAEVPEFHDDFQIALCRRFLIDVRSCHQPA